MKALFVIAVPTVALLVSACAPEPVHRGYGDRGYEGRDNGDRGYYAHETVVVEGPGYDHRDSDHRDSDHRGYQNRDIHNERDVNVNRTTVNERTVNRTNVNEVHVKGSHAAAVAPNHATDRKHAKKNEKVEINVQQPHP